MAAGLEHGKAGWTRGRGTGSGDHPLSLIGLLDLDPVRRSAALDAVYLSSLIARMGLASQDDGAETLSGLRADPGAVPGASTLEA